MLVRNTNPVLGQVLVVLPAKVPVRAYSGQSPPPRALNRWSLCINSYPSGVLYWPGTLTWKTHRRRADFFRKKSKSTRIAERGYGVYLWSIGWPLQTGYNVDWILNNCIYIVGHRTGCVHGKCNGISLLCVFSLKLKLSIQGYGPDLSKQQKVKAFEWRSGV